MRKIHFDICDAFRCVAETGRQIKVAPKVVVTTTDVENDIIGLYYNGRLCATRKAFQTELEGSIYKGYMWDSPTAMGYYRAFFGLTKKELGKKGGVVFTPSSIALL